MRLTLKSRITVGLAIIVLLGVASMLTVYAGLLHLQRTVHTLADVETPAVGATYEMEINVLGYAMAVLRYLDGHDPRDRERAVKDRADFRASHARYVRFAGTDQARALARLDRYYREFDRLGQDLMARSDHGHELFVSVMRSLQRIDAIIDDRLPPRVNRSDPAAVREVAAILEMKAELAAFAFGLVNYRSTHGQEDLDGARETRLALERNLRAFKREMSAGSVTGRALDDLQRVFDESVAALTKAHAIQEGLARDSRSFWDLREKIDALLDDEVQVAALADLAAPRVEADRAAQAVVRVSTILLPLFLLCATAGGGVLIQSVMRPVRRLSRGTAAVRDGNLAYRVESDGGDELAALGREFNRMVAQLEATTVSKTSLEISEAQLREANRALKQEIEERQRAEEALGRSELLAAMGSLVAGVAHEVRNPLFGMSSTLDALQARLKRAGAEAPYAEHVHVLRGELERLRRLMQDLLDYGKPPVIERVDSSVADTVAAAVRSCEAFAARHGVTLTTRIQPGVDVCTMDRSRIEQVIRNLLDNAIQHSPPGGTVWLTAHAVSHGAPRSLCLRVRDQGVGFDQAQLPRVFEPFFTRRSGGTGLGLSIVERIVDAHGGHVHAVNVPGGGAELIVELPVDRSPIGREEVAHAAQGPGGR